MEFIRGHGPSAILRELVQNEYDAGGSRLEVTFGESGLEVTGNGTPIDGKGWRRLSVTLGTGSVPDLKGNVEEKANGIGSKNFGLRSLFLFGDKIYVRSNGRQTVLDLKYGTPEQPYADPTTAGTRGVRIHVPYRTERAGHLNAFTASSEFEVLNDFAAHISPTLLKLAQPGAVKSLRDVIVSSAREERRITWRQRVEQLASPKRGVTLLVRRITMIDSKLGRTEAVEELEWQRKFELPEKFREERIPGYFRERASRIRIGVSLRTKRRKLHPVSPAGIAYYPIGIEHAYTGNNVSVSAPFEMDSNRSELVDPSNSPFNAWLLDLAADMTIELLRADLFERFGADAYRAVGAIDRSTLSTYSDAVEAGLIDDACWPTWGRVKRKKFHLAPAHDLIVVSGPSLEGFLSDDRYLHPALSEDLPVRTLAIKYGVKDFTVNSLVHLRCAGKESGGLESKYKEGEAWYYYPEFPEPWKDLTKQKHCAAALDAHRRELSGENRRDLAASETTLTARESLAAAEDLWFVPNEISDVCPVSPEHRLHPELSQGAVLRDLCRRFNVTKWIEDVTDRLAGGEAESGERLALYKYLVSVGGRVPKRLLPVVRNSPVLLDRNENWVSPRSITVPAAAGVRRFRLALHLPHRDYAKDKTLAKALRFKNKVTGDDVVRFAEIVSAQPELAQEFEQALERSRGLLTPRAISRLKSIDFLRSNDGQLRSPPSLYLDTPKNRACIGPEGPYPAGNAKNLYSKLGCRSRPKEERIVEYLATLRLNGEAPPRPDPLYPELVAALKRESTPDLYQDEEILWTGDGYNTPADTLVGINWDKIFLGNVPTVNASGAVLKRAYLELGAHRRPQQRHWDRLLTSLGERYREEPLPLSGGDQKAIHAAYIRCDGMPSVLSDVPWLLDDSGHLHKQSEITSGHFVIEDNLALAKELRKVGAPVSFADDANPAIISFFHRLGVKYLTEVRENVDQKIGKLRSSPNWFREEEYVRRLGRADLGLALEAIAARDFSGNSRVVERIHGAAERLSSIERIAFADGIYVDYRVGRTIVEISAKSAWIGDRIYLTWVRGRAGLEGTLASLIAQECLPDAADHARFSDSVYRLITCEKSRDIQEYLEGRGIKWRPVSDDSDDDADDYMSEVEEALRAAVRRNGPSPGGRGEAGAQPAGGDDRDKFVEEDDSKEQDVDEEVPFVLPPIDEVTPRVDQPSEDWSYSPGSSTGGSWGGGGGGSPGSRNEERDREIGRRGEQIVYRLEQARVRKLGNPKDRVVWVSESEPGADFDIESVDDDGEKLFIEVKSTTGSEGKFYWSMPEFQRALQERNRYILYRVDRANERSPVVRAFRNPISLMSRGALHLDIQSLRAEVEPSN